MRILSLVLSLNLVVFYALAQNKPSKTPPKQDKGSTKTKVLNEGKARINVAPIPKQEETSIEDIANELKIEEENENENQFEHISTLEALKKVCDLKPLKVKSLTVGGADNYKTFPEDAYKFKNLTTLIIENPIQFLPEQISNFKNLKKIQVSSYKNLYELPQALFELPNLEELDLSNTKITKLPANIGNLKHLKILAIPALDIPEGITQLQNLEELTITSSSGDLRPYTGLEFIGELTKLQKLKISPAIMQLPESFKKLSELTELRFSLMDNVALNDVFDGMKSLENLEINVSNADVGYGGVSSTLHHNYIDGYRTITVDLPNSFGNLSQLKTLDIQVNKIGNLANALNGLKSLEKLHIVGGNIGDFPASLGNLKNLIMLSVSRAGISSFPKELNNLEHLREFAANSNKFTSLPDMSKLNKLRLLQMNGNNLTEISPSIYTLTGLESIELNNNQLQALPDGIGNLVYLKELSINKNKIRTLPSDIGKCILLSFFKANYNQLTEIPSTLTNCRKLYSLSASNNKLKSLEGDFEKLNSLSELDVSNNELSGLPEGLSYSESLREINAINNRITALPKDINNYKYLSTLKLGNNQIESLPTVPSFWKNISTIDISRNKINSLPMAILKSNIGKVSGHDDNFKIFENPLTDVPKQCYDWLRLRNYGYSQAIYNIINPK